MKAINEMGYEKPTPVQAQSLPILLGEDTDFLGLAATGTGKTAAFSIPLLERIDPSVRAVQGVILCPTRELALQVAGQIDLLGKFLGVRALPIYGGSPYGDQIRGLKQGATIVVGTPGRICDHLDKGTLNLSQLKTLVLDEADEMISMGFKEDLEKILSASPRENSQIWLFSATMSREVRRIADDYLRNPEHVQVNRTEIVPEAIDQIYYRAHESDKPEILCKLMDAADDFYGLIFCQTKALVMDLTQYLNGRGYRVDCLHGDMDQNARERTMQAFRDRAVTVLVCTDVASRGLDVKDITHVINYSLPRELDNYVHRIGRTARSGKKGFAMSLVTPSHRILVSRIENMTKSRMREGRLPTRREIGTLKVSKALTKFQAVEHHTRAIEVMDTAWKDAIAEMSREEIVGRFLALNFQDVFEDRKDGSEPAVREPAQQRSGRPDRGGDRGDRGSYGEQRSYGGGNDRYRTQYTAPTGKKAPIVYGEGKASTSPAAVTVTQASASSVAPATNAAPTGKSGPKSWDRPVKPEHVKTGYPKKPFAKAAFDGGVKPAFDATQSARKPEWKTAGKRDKPFAAKKNGAKPFERDRKATGFGNWNKPLTRSGR
jgi:ATP-dependent RNA helicase DeaD